MGQQLVGFAGSCVCGRNPRLWWERFPYCFSAPYLDISLNPVSATYSQLQSLADVLCPELVLAVVSKVWKQTPESCTGVTLSCPVSGDNRLSTGHLHINAEECKPGRASPGFSSSIFPFKCKFCSDEQMDLNPSVRGCLSVGLAAFLGGVDSTGSS